MYNPLFKEPCTHTKEPRLFRFVSGWSCCSEAAAISHRQGADEISFYFVSPYKIKEAKAKTKRGETFCKLREHQNYRHLLMKNVWFSPIILHKSVIGCDDDPSSHPMDTCHGNWCKKRRATPIQRDRPSIILTLLYFDLIEILSLWNSILWNAPCFYNGYHG